MIIRKQHKTEEKINPLEISGHGCCVSVEFWKQEAPCLIAVEGEAGLAEACPHWDLDFNSDSGCQLANPWIPGPTSEFSESQAQSLVGGQLRQLRKGSRHHKPMDICVCGSSGKEEEGMKDDALARGGQHSVLCPMWSLTVWEMI